MLFPKNYAMLLHYKTYQKWLLSLTYKYFEESFFFETWVLKTLVLWKRDCTAWEIEKENIYKIRVATIRPLLLFFSLADFYDFFNFKSEKR